MTEKHPDVAGDRVRIAERPSKVTFRGEAKKVFAAGKGMLDNLLDRHGLGGASLPPRGPVDNDPRSPGDDDDWETDALSEKNARYIDHAAEATNHIEFSAENFAFCQQKAQELLDNGMTEQDLIYLFDAFLYQGLSADAFMDQSLQRIKQANELFGGNDNGEEEQRILILLRVARELIAEVDTLRENSEPTDPANDVMYLRGRVMAESFFDENMIFTGNDTDKIPYDQFINEIGYACLDIQGDQEAEAARLEDEKIQKEARMIEERPQRLREAIIDALPPTRADRLLVETAFFMALNHPEQINLSAVFNRPLTERVVDAINAHLGDVCRIDTVFTNEGEQYYLTINTDNQEAVALLQNAIDEIVR